MKKGVSGSSDKRERNRRMASEILDALLYSGLVTYVGWVAWTQSASLAAPTTAICTAVLLMPRVAVEFETHAEQWRRPLIAVGTLLTAFLWLLSTIQPDAEILPSNPSQAIIVFLGWSLATSMIVVAPFVVVFRSYADEGRRDTFWSRVRDYGAGIVASVLAHALGVFMYGISEDIIGPVESDRPVIPFLIVSAVLTGWLMVFVTRGRSEGSHDVSSG